MLYKQRNAITSHENKPLLVYQKGVFSYGSLVKQTSSAHFIHNCLMLHCCTSIQR